MSVDQVTFLLFLFTSGQRIRTILDGWITDFLIGMAQGVYSNPQGSVA